MVTLLSGQQLPSSINIGASIPQSVQVTSASSVGAIGLSQYYYWVIANYPIGGVAPANPGFVNNAPSPLTSGNYVSISWNNVSGATNYTILRTFTPNFPGSCSGCLVASGVTGVSYN